MGDEDGAGIVGDVGPLGPAWLGPGVAQPMTSNEPITTREAVAIRWGSVISSSGCRWEAGARSLVTPKVFHLIRPDQTQPPSVGTRPTATAVSTVVTVAMTPQIWLPDGPPEGGHVLVGVGDSIRTEMNG